MTCICMYKTVHLVLTVLFVFYHSNVCITGFCFGIYLMVNILFMNVPKQLLAFLLSKLLPLCSKGLFWNRRNSTTLSMPIKRTLQLIGNDIAKYITLEVCIEIKHNAHIVFVEPVQISKSF